MPGTGLGCPQISRMSGAAVPELAAALACLGCPEAFEGRWPVQEGQDVEEVAPAMQRCPWCGDEAVRDYPHWQYFTEAG